MNKHVNKNKPDVNKAIQEKQALIDEDKNRRAREFLEIIQRESARLKCSIHPRVTLTAGAEPDYSYVVVAK